MQEWAQIRVCLFRRAVDLIDRTKELLAKNAESIQHWINISCNGKS